MLRNGFGEPIYHPSAYFRAVAEDRYGFNSRSTRYDCCDNDDFDASCDLSYDPYDDCRCDCTCSCDDDW
jgi:hypothetical protein